MNQAESTAQPSPCGKSKDPVKRILFVCLGNICRSPAAEGVFQKLVAEQGLQQSVHVDSAGTAGYHIGKPADARMIAAADERGFDLTSRSRQVTARDIELFDLVVAMDRANYRDLLNLARTSKTDHIRLLSDFLDKTIWPAEVPDPYYGGQADFEYVLDMLQAASPQLLSHLLNV
jgi:protein-tyrosine phosphatase